MSSICPSCEIESELELKYVKESIKVRGEPIEVEMKYYKCLSCGEEFEDPRSDYDPLDKAYREYRHRHRLTRPEEIRSFRKRYGFTQYEMSRLLGWGLATLNRYENGALQSEANENTLKLVMDPHNLLRLIEETPNVLDKEKKDCLIKELTAEEEESYSFKRIYEERFGRYEADELSGYKKLNIAKLFNAILFFCKGGGIYRTKLNKLLFYGDFKHFKDYAVSITGARYAHIPFGPAPDKYEYYFATLIENNVIEAKEVDLPLEAMGEQLVSVKEPDFSLFSDSELKVLLTVKEHFKDFTAKKITEFSHDEKGYRETLTGKLISYKYADKLKL